MKYAIILPDGAADEPVESLNGRTPLEAAHTPNLDRIATIGQVGRVRTTPAGFDPGSDICTLTLLGYPPGQHHAGRAPLEAAARGIPLDPEDLVFRCNLVTIANGRMRDFAAGHIEQTDADRLIADLNELFCQEPLQVHTGVQYRNLLVAHNARLWQCCCTPPHDIPDQLVAKFQPTGPDAMKVSKIMALASTFLASHPINSSRVQNGLLPATDIWLWGQGSLTKLPKFGATQNRDLRCASVAAVDLIRGITTLAGFESINVQGATGYLDTDYAAKGRAAVQALSDFDLVCVHVEAPDEAGHQGDAAAKVIAIEQIDAHVVGPVLECLWRQPQWRIMIAPDHPTPVKTRIHSATPPPFCMAGTGIAADDAVAFNEAAAANRPLIDPGDALIRTWLNDT